MSRTKEIYHGWSIYALCGIPNEADARIALRAFNTINDPIGKHSVIEAFRILIEHATASENLATVPPGTLVFLSANTNSTDPVIREEAMAALIGLENLAKAKRQAQQE